MGGVVVADDVQLEGMGPGDQFEEGQELGIGVPGIAGVGGDFAGGNLKGGEQAGGAIADVIVGLLFGYWPLSLADY